MEETDHSKNDRLKQDIEANLIRHCDLLGDNQTYYFYSEDIWQTHWAQISEDKQHRFFSDIYGVSGKTPSVILRRYLRPSVFKNFLSIYELFINNLLSLWLKAHPGILNERSISFRDFYHASSKERVIDEIIEREIIGILYKNPRDVIHFIYRKFLGKNYYDSLTHDMIAGLAELKALRDVLEHNDGRINIPKPVENT